MTTIKLSGLLGSLIGPLRTVDSAAPSMPEWLALLDADDRAKVKAILEKKYSAGSSGMTVNGVGATVATGDAARAQRRAEIEHNQTVAAGYADFWAKAASEGRAWG